MKPQQTNHPVETPHGGVSHGSHSNTGLRYRAWQLWQALRAQPLSEAAQQHIATILTPAEQKLFYQFSLNDQTHSYRVLTTLLEADYQEPNLLTAALLHDIGKTRYNLTIINRITVVLGQMLTPQQLPQWGQGSPDSWRKPFVVKEKHADWGADMTAEIGSNPTVVSLIRRHQDILDEVVTVEDELLHHLQWADDQN